MTDTIVHTLVQEGGYKQVLGPLRVVDTDFGTDFDAVLVGPGEQGCLVLVVDGDQISPALLQRRVRSFALVLDRSGSRRPLTVILIVKTPSTFEALERHCRVIVVTPDVDLLSALRGLLPLRIKSHEQTLHAAEDALESKLEGNIANPLTATLLKAAQTGSANVEEEILRAINLAIDSSLHRDDVSK